MMVAAATSPPWYNWMQPTNVGVPKFMLIHTSLPPGARPRHALEYAADISRPGMPLKAFSAACMFIIVHKK